MPWFDSYDAADIRRRERIREHGGVVAPSGAVLYPDRPDPTPPAPVLPPEPMPEPAMPGLLGWIVALITTR